MHLDGRPRPGGDRCHPPRRRVDWEASEAVVHDAFERRPDGEGGVSVVVQGFIGATAEGFIPPRSGVSLRDFPARPSSPTC